MQQQDVDLARAELKAVAELLDLAHVHLTPADPREEPMVRAVNAVQVAIEGVRAALAALELVDP